MYLHDTTQSCPHGPCQLQELFGNHCKSLPLYQQVKTYLTEPEHLSLTLHTTWINPEHTDTTNAIQASNCCRLFPSTPTQDCLYRTVSFVLCYIHISASLSVGFCSWCKCMETQELMSMIWFFPLLCSGFKVQYEKSCAVVHLNY